MFKSRKIKVKPLKILQMRSRSLITIYLLAFLSGGKSHIEAIVKGVSMRLFVTLL